MKLNILSFKTIPSTNLYLKENYESLHNHTVCIAENQTQGRGRLGRAWQDSKGSALFSILIKDYVSDATFIPLVCGYAIIEVLKKHINNLEVKWPNDIICNSKKLAGILVESVVTNKIEAIIIGIGININNSSFSEEIKDIATSMVNETNTEYDINLIINDITKLIITTLSNLNRATIIEYLNNVLWIKDKVVIFTYKGISSTGKVIKINEDGSLKITTETGEFDVFSGEVTLTNNYK